MTVIASMMHSRKCGGFNYGQKDDSNLQTNTVNPFIDGS